MCYQWSRLGGRSVRAVRAVGTESGGNQQHTMICREVQSAPPDGWLLIGRRSIFNRPAGASPGLPQATGRSVRAGLFHQPTSKTRDGNAAPART